MPDDSDSSEVLLEYYSARENILRKRLLTQGIGVSYLMDHFSNYAHPQCLARFLFRYEMYKMASGLQGSIIECGVHTGTGLMTWAILASLLDPLDINKCIYGFDTFSGFPKFHQKDAWANTAHAEIKDFSRSFYDDLIESINLYETFFRQDIGNRSKSITLIKGDFLETGKSFLDANSHLLISILYLDFDLYEPTKLALELFLPRVLKGGLICFDELNHPEWPGETLAILEKLNLKDYNIRKFPLFPEASYLVI